MAKIKVNTEERRKWDLNDPTQKSRINDLCEQYQPLVVKITGQMFRKMNNGCNWDDILSMANEGLALAIKGYDPERSKMKFTQYAAFAIRNNILNCMCTDIHAISLNSYAISKMKERGESVFTSIRLNAITGESGGEDSYSREAKYGMFYEDINAGEIHPLQKLVNFVKDHFKDSDSELFFRVYGLCGYEECTAAQIAKERKVTCGAISQRMKAIMTKIKANAELLESLSALL